MRNLIVCQPCGRENLNVVLSTLALTTQSKLTLKTLILIDVDGPDKIKKTKYFNRLIGKLLNFANI